MTRRWAFLLAAAAAGWGAPASIAAAAPAPLIAEGYAHGYAGLFRVGLNGQRTRITRELTDAHRLSPDGRTLAYVASSAVRLIGLDGRHRRTLLRYGSRSVFQLRWSPNGRRLALIELTAEETDPQVIVIDVASGAQRVLPAPQAPAGGVHGFFGLTWAPDSRQLALEESMATRAPGSVSYSPAGHGIRILDPDGRPFRTLTTTAQPVLDDRALAYSPRAATLAVGGERGIELWGADGVTHRTVVTDPVGEVSWSPDGRRLLASLAPAAPGDHRGLVVDAAGGRVHRFTGEAGCWSPDGSRFTVRRHGQAGVLGRDGTGFRRIPSKLTLIVRAWAPSPS